MNLPTKYEMGQRLFAIHQSTVERPPVKCPACENGTVELRGERYQCPRCKGKQEIQVSAHGWVISNNGRVGNISAEYKSPDWDERWGDGEVRAGTLHLFVHYMLDTTGINSGTLHTEPNLFPSREEAQAECDRRNGWSSAKVTP